MRVVLVLWICGLVFGGAVCPGIDTQTSGSSPSIWYTNYRITSVPWSIHVVQMQRNNPVYQIQSVHAKGSAIGLETLSEQLARIDSARGVSVAGVNGDFYQRDKAFAGAPRGLQIVNGELISAPCGGASFWTDALGQYHMTNVASRFQITWPGGTTTEFGLNGERQADRLELYSPAIGVSTHMAGGRELVLARTDGSRWLPLRIGQTYVARVEQIHEGGNTPVPAEGMVLSLGPKLLAKLPTVQTGSVLRISTESTPALRGVRMAISGGPILIVGGNRQKTRSMSSEAYEFSSMLERHPRSAIGWNEHSFFLVEVDGRQKGLSVGMTLDELSKFLIDLGCEEALNLDGGGSATLWYEGQVQNNPCDRAEREIANAIVVLKRAASGTGDAEDRH
ncbi:MAG TPA: phosphodiester glycosidase family protein [Candidatus Limnocylindrales bacterium]|jgi:hypothetical protein|nr:phosphodiester glycosidase family protein [Candidatus Limnocylindrales bacterium]